MYSWSCAGFLLLVNNLMVNTSSEHVGRVTKWGTGENLSALTSTHQPTTLPTPDSLSLARANSSEKKNDQC